MSAKNRDEHGRWRSKTIAFRVTPEENTLIDTLAKLSGMTKQDYIIHRLTNRDVVVVGNPRVHKALKRQMEQLILEFQKLTSATELTPGNDYRAGISGTYLRRNENRGHHALSDYEIRSNYTMNNKQF